MLASYIERTALDRDFYTRYLKDRMPERLLDSHQHLMCKRFLTGVTPETIADDWSMQCYEEMPYEDSIAFAHLLFPDTPFDMNALTTVDSGSDLNEANRYLAELIHKGRVRYAMMTIHPSWSAAEVEKTYVEGGFTGFKPYPDLVSGRKGVDISILHYITPKHLRILNQYKGAMVLHIPRAERLADPRNVEELKRLHDEYPYVKMIVAHMGHSYSTDYIEKGLALLGDYARDMTFDLAAVLNPQVLSIAFDALDPHRILWGSDLPVFMWHGKRRWTNREYFNLAREDFAWNHHEEGPEAEAGYTFFLYEQMRNILDTIEHRHGGRGMVNDVFWRNAERILGGALARR